MSEWAIVALQDAKYDGWGYGSKFTDGDHIGCWYVGKMMLMSGEQTEPVDITERCPAIGNIIEDEYICARTANQPHGENIGFFVDYHSNGHTYTPEEEWYDEIIEYYND